MLCLIKSLAEKFDVDKFYTNIRKEEDIWKWVRTGKSLTTNTQDDGIWNKGESSDHKSESGKSENCV